MSWQKVHLSRLSHLDKDAKDVKDESVVLLMHVITGLGRGSATYSQPAFAPMVA
jgi:hypothetical protein